MSGSGNMAQSALSSSVSYGVKKQTGKNTDCKKSNSEQNFKEWNMLRKIIQKERKRSVLEFIDQTNSKTCAAIKAVIKEDISEKNKNC